jgi:hypothetical protein
MAHFPGHPIEALTGYYCSVVGGPPANDGVQPGDQPFLGCSPEVADSLLQLVLVTLLGFGRGFDECLESQGLTVFALSRVAFPHPVLLYPET